MLAMLVFNANQIEGLKKKKKKKKKKRKKN